MIFYVQWNAAAVSLDCNILTFSKKTYEHLYNLALDSSMDEQHAVKWYCSGTSRRLDYYPLCWE